MENYSPEIGTSWRNKVDKSIVVKIIQPTPLYKRKKIQYLYEDGNVGGYNSSEAFYADWSPVFLSDIHSFHPTYINLPMPKLRRSVTPDLM
jgi:hypothetical protein